MKALLLINLIAFLLFTGCSKNADNIPGMKDPGQSKAAPVNGTVSYFYTGGYFADLTCGEVVIDHVYGNVEWHVRDHYKNGEIEWSIYNATGSLTSTNGEVFDIHESDKLYWTEEDWTFHCNLIGDQGNHYILSGHGDVTTWEVFVDRANCP